MQQIVLDGILGQKLSALSEQVVVCDSGGRVLGLFSPLPEHSRLEDLQLEPPLSIEETEALRKKNRTGRPLEDILRDLGY
jgi:hypothetical protein